MTTIRLPMVVLTATLLSTSGAFAAGQQSGQDQSYGQKSGQQAQSGSMGMSSQKLSSDQVRQVQEELAERGHQIDVDGIWGPKTQQALRDFQKEQGMQETGQLNQQTASALGLSGQSFGLQEDGQGASGMSGQPSQGKSQ